MRKVLKVDKPNNQEYIKGRGAQFRTANPWDKTEVIREHPEGLDEELISQVQTQPIIVHAKTIVNKVDSPDVGMVYSLNPYQGCEHGCIYCYARNTHEYWGYSAGLDFESRILVKPNAPELLTSFLERDSWKATPISLSGNTDCYQPLERKFGITRQLLQVFARYRNPVGIITKNQLILRDLDILKELASQRLIQVMVSITSLDEDLRLQMEPRTVSYKNRLKVLEQLSMNGIPAGVMVAPIIPGLNSSHIPDVIKAAAGAGAVCAGYTIVRLNGSVATLFKDWLHKNYPDRFNKVWSQIEACHGGQVNDSRFGKRMHGEGNIAQSIMQLFKVARSKYMPASVTPLNTKIFRRPPRGQMKLF